MTDQKANLTDRLKRHIERNRECCDPAKQRDAWLAQEALNEIERLSTPAREAAEELLEALEDAERALDILVHHGFIDRPKHKHRATVVLVNVRAAITKAKGET